MVKKKGKKAPEKNADDIVCAMDKKRQKDKRFQAYYNHKSHPLIEYVPQNTRGMSADSLDKKLSDEGWLNLSYFLTDKSENNLDHERDYHIDGSASIDEIARKMMNIASVLIKYKKEIERIRIYPNYLTSLSRFQALKQISIKQLGNNSAHNDWHGVYIMLKKKKK